MTKSRPLAWIDLEMTGLNPKLHHILEVALIVTDHKGVVQNRFDTVIDWGDSLELILARMDDHVTEMHTKSGLLVALEQARFRGPSLEDVEESIVNKLRREGVTASYDAQATLAGSSVHTDRGFIRSWMPELDKLLHYRLLDVSAFKVAFPSLFPRTDSAHRARDDIQASLDMLYTMQGVVDI